jgi:hypothetical protein
MSGTPRRPLGMLPAGPVFLVPAVRERTVPTVTDAELRQVLTVTVSILAGMARQNELDARAMPMDLDAVPLSWQDVCDWLVGISGRDALFPEREQCIAADRLEEAFQEIVAAQDED